MNDLKQKPKQKQNNFYFVCFGLLAIFILLSPICYSRYIAWRYSLFIQNKSIINAFKNGTSAEIRSASIKNGFEYVRVQKNNSSSSVELLQQINLIPVYKVQNPLVLSPTLKENLSNTLPYVLCRSWQCSLLFPLVTDKGEAFIIIQKLFP